MTGNTTPPCDSSKHLLARLAHSDGRKMTMQLGGPPLRLVNLKPDTGASGWTDQCLPW